MAVSACLRQCVSACCSVSLYVRRVCTRLFEHMCVCLRLWLFVRTRLRIFVFVCERVFVRVFMSAFFFCVYVFTYGLCTCLCPSACVCVYLRMFDFGSVLLRVYVSGRLRICAFVLV